MSHKEAEQYVRKEDEARINYLRHYFNRDPNDPLLYHLIINTDKISPEEAAIVVGDAVIRHFNLLNHKKSEEPILTPAIS
jgi:cytidylate kinase